MDTYTGIDTLIDIDGYYYNSMIFYDNGLVVDDIWFGYTSERYENVSLFLKEIVDNPEAKDSKSFYDFVRCGSYVICSDTIKVQMMYKSHSFNDNWSAYEHWYKIIDGNLCLLDWFMLTTNKKEKEQHRRNRSIFIPAGRGAKMKVKPVPVKPDPDYFWILKEKWFWQNESDWKAFMEKIKQKQK
jgi:hypothetical protein